MKLTKGLNDLSTVNPDLAKEWDYEVNGDLKPTDVTANSNKKVGWICKKNHKWLATVANRTKGSGCPYCAGKSPIKGETDLQTVNPELAKEWDYEANGEFKPTDVTVNAGKKVGWVCKNGHKWQASVYNRNNGTGCPCCAGKLPVKGETDLQTVNPELAKEWDYEVNGELKPTDVTVNSGKKVGWKCEKGHKWRAIINARNNGARCPYCVAKKAIEGETDLLTVNPELAKEWDYEANGELKPTDVTANSGKKVGWKCKKGHKWQATICNRNKETGCPYCAGRLAIKGETDLLTVNPKLAREWDNEVNGELKPTDVTAGSRKKVGWKCEKGHKWLATIHNRSNGTGCPYCATKIDIKRENE